jgi:hemerythrin-like domain-containing protein
MSHKAPMPSLISTPAVGFDQPFEMLEACHDRVDRSLQLLQRLVTHIDTTGHDASSRSAASDVMRYFDLAAPHHHLDEELHVFPVVASCGELDLANTVKVLRDDHEVLHQQWAELRATLQTWTQAKPTPNPISALVRELVIGFCTRYAEHKRLEDNVVYPAARGLISNHEAIQAMGSEMRSRRQNQG